MRRISLAYLVLVALFVVSVSANSAAALAQNNSTVHSVVADSLASSYPFAGGDGSVTNPYVIEDASQLDAVHYYLDKCFVLGKDIVFNDEDFNEGGDYFNDGKGWIPIGSGSGKAFTGIFDGGGHEIRNLVVQSDMSSGLFGSVSGTVKNLGLVEFDIECHAPEDAYPNCGGICSYLSGTMVNCHTKNGIVRSEIGNCACGGLVGCLNFSGRILYSSNAADVTSSYRAGGIAGMVGGNSGLMRECCNTGTITAKAAGGIAGGIFRLNAYDCYNTGRIQGSEYAGGLNGTAGNSNNITNFFNTGEVVGEGSLGSVSGNFYTGSLTNCYCSKSIQTSSCAEDATVIASGDFINPESFAGFDFETVWRMGDTGPILQNVGSRTFGHELIMHEAIAATCVTSGNNEYYVCDYCGTVFKSDKETVTTVALETLPAQGHKLEKHEAKDPTCLEDGNNEYYVCATCGITFRADKKTETLAKYEVRPALGHVWAEAYAVDKPASCTEEGSESIHCAACGEQKEGTSRVIAKLEHAYGEWAVTKEPTYTEPGVREKDCAVCGDKIVEAIDCLVHSAGWVYENGGYYYYDANGRMAKDVFIPMNGKYYYVGADGRLVMGGWIEYGGTLYYIDSDWSLALNRWVENGGEWYYFDETAQLVANGWKRIGGKSYYFDENAKLSVNRFVQYGSAWYYFDETAQLVVNAWKQISGKSYYFDENAQLAVNTLILHGGKYYYFDGNAQLVTDKWVGAGNDWYYLKPDGSLALNEWVTYQGYACHFNASGVCDYAAAA